jgi:hypothetical protein
MTVKKWQEELSKDFRAGFFSRGHILDTEESLPSVIYKFGNVINE